MVIKNATAKGKVDWDFLRVKGVRCKSCGKKAKKGGRFWDVKNKRLVSDFCKDCRK